MIYSFKKFLPLNSVTWSFFCIRTPCVAYKIKKINKKIYNNVLNYALILTVLL